jgi:hypothetical protein
MTAKTIAAISIRPGKPDTPRLPITPVTGLMSAIGSTIMVPIVVSR